MFGRSKAANSGAARMPAHILVVDDDPRNVRLLADWLASENYLVSTAADGFEALAKIAAERPDIVLLDVVMPELNGFEVCRRIKADPAIANIPVIMVTALSDVDDLVRGFEAGADDFVTKPIIGLALMARVRSQLRRKRHYEHILEESRVDPLTGAFNRRYFDAHAPRLAARCRVARKPIALEAKGIERPARIGPFQPRRIYHGQAERVAASRCSSPTRRRSFPAGPGL